MAFRALSCHNSGDFREISRENKKTAEEAENFTKDP